MKKNITISYSKISTFKSCPQKYYLNEEYSTDMNASALPFGSAVEAGIDIILQKGDISEAKNEFRARWHTAPKNNWEAEKIIYDSDKTFYYASDYDENLLANETDLAKILDWKNELLAGHTLDWDAILENFQEQVKVNGYIDPVERKFAHRVIWLCCLRRGEIMLEAFEKHLLPQIEKVVSYQKWTSMHSPDGHKFVGKIDYIMKLKDYKEPILVDFKTAGKFYGMHELETSDQLSGYAASEGLHYIAYMVVLKAISHKKRCNSCNHERENNRKIKCEVCETGRYTKVESEAKTQILVRKMRETEADEVMADFSDVLSSIEAGHNWKNPSACFNFGKTCEFYDFCWKGEDLDKIPALTKRQKKS